MPTTRRRAVRNNEDDPIILCSSSSSGGSSDEIDSEYDEDIEEEEEEHSSSSDADDAIMSNEHGDDDDVEEKDDDDLGRTLLGKRLRKRLGAHKQKVNGSNADDDYVMVDNTNKSSNKSSSSIESNKENQVNRSSTTKSSRRGMLKNDADYDTARDELLDTDSDDESEEASPFSSPSPPPVTTKPAPKRQRRVRNVINNNSTSTCIPAIDLTVSSPPPVTSSFSSSPINPAKSTKQNHRNQTISASTYLSNLNKSLSKRKYSLSSIPNHQSINTGRTIQPLKSWKGLWPPLREFFQNTIDHLGLMDGRTGQRNSCVNLHVNRNPTTTTTSNSTSTSSHDASIQFTCQDETLCTIDSTENELIIHQHYTFPIASRALDTGVPDTTKSASSVRNGTSNQAGGFGDGFKTAAVALLAMNESSTKARKRTNVTQLLSWVFYLISEKTKVIWNFHGVTRESIATFAKCQVLQVDITKKSMSAEEIQMYSSSSSSISSSSSGGSVSEGSSYVMKQIIQVKGIGKAFIQEVIPRLVVFWNINEDSLVCSTGRPSHNRGCDYIGPVSLQLPIFNGACGQDLLLKSGIYVKGIWVKETKIQGTFMVFGSKLEVSGRDRNDVDDEDLHQAFVHVLHKCDNMNYLRNLLEPLRGSASSTNDDSHYQHIGCNCFSTSSSSSSSSSSSRNRRGRLTTTQQSWLLKSPRFFNRIIETEKDFILQTVFNIPKGAIFVSSKTTNSKEPFIKWSSSFLARNGVTLHAIEKGANKFLFEEVNQDELTKRCVTILKKNLVHGGTAQQTQSSLKKFLTFLGSPAKIYASQDLAVAFVHNSTLFIPDAPLTRDLLIRILNVCNTRLESSHPEAFSSLLCAVFEEVSVSNTRLLPNVVKKIIDRAKKVQKESKKFVMDSSSATRSSKDDDEIIVDDDDGTAGAGRSRTSRGNKGGGGDPYNLNNVLDKITALNEYQIDQALPVIPGKDFQDDMPGNDSCLRPSSSLLQVNVNQPLGGGTMMVDPKNAEDINSWRTNDKRNIRQLREMLNEATDLVRTYVPRLEPLLGRLRHGYDGENGTYEAYFDGFHIVFNLYAYLPKLRSSSSRNLVHDFITTITHEIAHYLEPQDGHGPSWRESHMCILREVMEKLESNT